MAYLLKYCTRIKSQTLSTDSYLVRMFFVKEINNERIEHLVSVAGLLLTPAVSTQCLQQAWRPRLLQWLSELKLS